MTHRTAWRKSSHSGGGDGNACAEIATFPTTAFDPFLAALKNPSRTGS